MTIMVVMMTMVMEIILEIILEIREMSTVLRNKRPMPKAVTTP